MKTVVSICQQCIELEESIGVKKCPRKQNAMSNAAELARTRVVVSGFSPWSFHEAKRRFRVVFFGRTRARFPTPIKFADDHDTERLLDGGMVPNGFQPLARMKKRTGWHRCCAQ